MSRLIPDCSIISVCEGKRNVYPHAKTYEDKAIRLVYSLRKNGGACKDFPVYMWYGEDVPPSKNTIDLLSSLGCTLISGKCRKPQTPVHNKVAACLDIRPETEYSLWMDTDMYVLGDFSDIFTSSPDVAASPTNYCYHRWARFSDKDKWDEFYRSAGIENPNVTMLTDMDQKEGIFYTCSGLFLFRNDICFPDFYNDGVEAVLSSSVEDKVENFSQTGLTVGIIKGRFKFKQLPEKYQLYYGLRGGLLEDTIIVHYQDSTVSEVPRDDWFAGGLIAGANNG